MRRTRYSLLMSLLAVIGALVLNIWYTNRVQQQTEQKFCGVMRIFDTPTAPATTARSIEIQNKFHRLRQDLSC